ncbi:hypothetical protein SAMN05660489_04694 [Pseudomonas sp. LAMO17WK12:I10]|uniref:DUF2169 family type VI secretion system accessory protein n=1 Tax=unclassified Pseudomonas TaxID=196821 RepID=UPI000BDD4747|nr:MULTISPECIES: DUF2169 domain-containing protein [unclassified Pseudomonas]PXX58254.1 hypothetical protein H160_05057 [Pseudomonas sp. LAMO17WK12:I9]SNY47670.1 hypothetical protein SAMN05660489_04694 [Pseudomonas sp. LAMO17WK12:I10]
MYISSNSTPYPAEVFVHADKRGQRHCVVVLKATFDVAPDGYCRPAEQQLPLVYVDQHWEDPSCTALRYESDFSPVKPRADVLIDGYAVDPSQSGVKVLDVAVAGPGLMKRARISGDRVWVGGLLQEILASEPIPFVLMPLSWDRAFGGSDLSHESTSRRGSELRNLVGRGFRLNGGKASVLGSLLPNIERLDRPMRYWDDKPEPIGFGPVGRAWQPRVNYCGTYDRHWMEQVKPFLPQDFDDRYFQSAPTDQQLDRLIPGSSFACMNMNLRGRFVAHLPNLNVPIRFCFQSRSELLTLVADTLTLQPGQDRVVLAGRVSVPLPRKVAALQEVQVGRQLYVEDGSKKRYSGLNEAIAALSRRY